MTPNQYQCRMCKGVFDKEWSDEEAWAEHDRDFPGELMETACVVCDDCYQKVRPDKHPVEYGIYKDALAESRGAPLSDAEAVLRAVFFEAMRNYILYGTATAPSSSPPPASEAPPSAAPDSPHESGEQSSSPVPKA